MARVHFVKKARKKNSVAKKGESYYHWSLKTGPYSSRKCYSKTPPRPSQLTSSDFLSAVYSLQEEIQDNPPVSMEDLQSMRDDWISRIGEIRDECQEKLDNMPEGLQQGSTGELLQERIDAMDNWASEMESVDLDYEPEEEEEKPKKGKKKQKEEKDDKEAELVEEKYQEILDLDPGV